jgi:hypothetical protein
VFCNLDVSLIKIVENNAEISLISERTPRLYLCLHTCFQKIDPWTVEFHDCEVINGIYVFKSYYTGAGCSKDD